GRGLGPAAGGRVRPVHARRALALPDGRLSEPLAAVPGVSGPGAARAPASGDLEARVLPLSPARHFPEPAAADPQVADAPLPYEGPVGAVPAGPVRPHRSRSVCRLPLHGEPVEVSLPHPRPAAAAVRRAG